MCAAGSRETQEVESYLRKRVNPQRRGIISHRRVRPTSRKLHLRLSVACQRPISPIPRHADDIELYFFKASYCFSGEEWKGNLCAFCNKFPPQTFEAGHVSPVRGRRRRVGRRNCIFNLFPLTLCFCDILFIFIYFSGNIPFNYFFFFS